MSVPSFRARRSNGPGCSARGAAARLAGARSLALCLVAGCGSQNLDLMPPLYPGVDSEDGCVARVAWVQHVDEPTELGFSAVEVLGQLAGNRHSALDWLEPEASAEYELEYGPEQGRSSLDLDVHAADGPIRLGWREPLASAPDAECGPGWLEIPVEVTLASGGSALTESFSATLSAIAPHRGQLSTRLRPGALRGGLAFGRVLSLDPERRFTVSALTLDVELWPGGSRGSLGVELESQLANPPEGLLLPASPPSAPGPLAIWPSARECGGGAIALPNDARVLGFSVQDVLDRLRQGGPRQLTWPDGAVTPVRLVPEPAEPELCQVRGSSLSFEGVLRAESMDGNLRVDLPVSIDASDAGGSIGAIEVETRGPLRPHPVAELSQDQRPIVRVGDYDAVLIDLRWSLGAAGDSGELSLRGLDAVSPDAEGNYPSTALSSARW